MSHLRYKTAVDYEFELEIKSSWGPIVEAAGLFNDKQTAASIFLLAGTIIKDRILLERYCAEQVAHVPTEGDGPWVDSAYVRVLNEMTEVERAALRVRVLARFGR